MAVPENDEEGAAVEVNIGGTTLECIMWSLVGTHQSAAYGFGFDHIRV